MKKLKRKAVVLFLIIVNINILALMLLPVLSVISVILSVLFISSPLFDKMVGYKKLEEEIINKINNI